MADFRGESLSSMLSTGLGRACAQPKPKPLFADVRVGPMVEYRPMCIAVCSSTFQGVRSRILHTRPCARVASAALARKTPDLEPQLLRS